MFELSVGPVQYYWSRDTLTHFYAEVADSPATTVCLGEVVCSRRHALKPEDWLDLAKDLRAAGKEVVIGTQALIETEAELRALRKWVEHGEYMLEANDAGAFPEVAEARNAGAPVVRQRLAPDRTPVITAAMPVGLAAPITERSLVPKIPFFTPRAKSSSSVGMGFIS